MTKEFKILAMMVLVTTPSSAQGLLNCPWNDYNQSWWVHFNWNAISEEAAPGSGRAYIYFDSKPKIPNSKLWKGACVKITAGVDKDNHTQTSYYSVSGYFSDSPYQYSYGYHNYYIRWNPDYKWDELPNVRQTIPAVSRFKLSIIDDIFTYNEAGELHHKAYGRVGRLSCDMPTVQDACLIGKFPTGGWKYGHFFLPN